jgi:hypothetical protein
MAGMPNLRVIYDNVADGCTVTASSTAGALVAANMLADSKTAVHRSVGFSVTYSMVWAAYQSVGAVALPATNLTKDATVRVRVYSGSTEGTLLVDSGVVGACASKTLGLHGWGYPVNANAFPFGGASKTAVWLPRQPANVRRCVVDIFDTSNPAGYIDCARIVAGPYWEALHNPDYGVTSGTADLSKVQRYDSGDTAALRGACYQTMALSLADIPATQRAELNKILRSAGSHKNLFISLLPGIGGDTEQDHMIYGKRASSPFTFDFFNSFSTRIEVEGW